MRKTNNSRSKSKSRMPLQQNKPSLANLMNHYKSDQSYNVKLNMNHHNPQIIETNSYQFTQLRQQSKSTWKRKDPFKDIVIMNQNNNRRGDSRYHQTGSNKRVQVTPKRNKLNNLFQHQSNNYFVSQPSHKQSSREGCSLFRQVLKKQSKQNSIATNSQYYDMIEKKANQIKEQKKKMLQRCHSNGTLSQFVQTMKTNTKKQIDEYARRILDDKQIITQQINFQSKQESKVQQIVGSVGSKDNSEFNSLFSFQIDTFQAQTPANNKQKVQQRQDSEYFSNQCSSNIIQNKQANELNPQRPFSKISHSKQNHEIQNKPILAYELTAPISSHHCSPKVNIPVNNFINPKMATIFKQVELKNMPATNSHKKSPGFVQFVPIVRKNSVNNKQRWIKIERPPNVDYLSQVTQNISNTHLGNQDFLKTNNFNYPFQNH